jgi:iron complex transport system substrate-binding protein
MKNQVTTPLRTNRKRIFRLAPSFALFVSTILVCVLLLLTGCDTSSKKTGHTESAAVDGKDYFPDKVTITHAKGFSIEYAGNYKVVRMVNPFAKQADTLRYILVQRGTPKPPGYPNSQVIEIPVRSMVGTSSMHIALAEFLESGSIITGLAHLQYVSSPDIRQKIADKKIVEVGVGDALNEEMLIAMHPDLIMTMGSPGAQFDRFKTLTDAGIPVMINSEWVETTPLGRTEWVKLMAALLNKEALVNEKLTKIEQEYNRLANLTRNVAYKPSIIANMNFKDAWHVPDGDSYMGHFFKDAGTTYQWANEKTTGSLKLDFESVYPVALKADYWLNLGYVDTKADVLAKDARYGDFKAFKEGKMYNYNKRVNEIGANDYWESGAVNPHLILADLIKILHPELLPDHQLYYYKQIN